MYRERKRFSHLVHHGLSVVSFGIESLCFRLEERENLDRHYSIRASEQTHSSSLLARLVSPFGCKQRQSVCLRLNKQKDRIHQTVNIQVRYLHLMQRSLTCQIFKDNGQNCAGVKVGLPKGSSLVLANEQPLVHRKSKINDSSLSSLLDLAQGAEHRLPRPSRVPPCLPCLVEHQINAVVRGEFDLRGFL